MKRKVCGKYPASRVTALKLSRNTPRRKTGARTICRILSHREEGSAYSLQWEVESSGMLHRWHLEQGVRLNDELTKIFKDKVIGFPTLMEVIE